MLCIALMSYSILYANGQESFHQHYTTKRDIANIEKLLADPEFRKGFQVYQIKNKKITKIKPQECP